MSAAQLVIMIFIFLVLLLVLRELQMIRRSNRKKGVNQDVVKNDLRKTFGEVKIVQPAGNKSFDVFTGWGNRTGLQY